MLQNFGAPFLVAVNNHFGVRICAKTMAAFLKLDAQFLEVVNFTIQDDPDCFFSVRHRLMASRQIDDGKSSEAKPYCTGNKVAFVIRTAVDHCLGHSPNRFQFHRVVPGEVKLAANAAHESEVGDQKSEVRGRPQYKRRRCFS